MLKYAALLAGLIGSSAIAEDPIVYSPLKNGQTFVCADLTASNVNDSNQIRQYVLGYWSGFNAANSYNSLPGVDVGATTSVNGIFGEIKLYCARNPSMDIPTAVLSTYLKFKRSGR